MVQPSHKAIASWRRMFSGSDKSLQKQPNALNMNKKDYVGWHVSYILMNDTSNSSNFSIIYPHNICCICHNQYMLMSA